MTANYEALVAAIREKFPEISPRLQKCTKSSLLSGIELNSALNPKQSRRRTALPKAAYSHGMKDSFDSAFF